MPDNPSAGERKAPHDPHQPFVSIRKPDGQSVGLSLDEYRLAMIGLVDFNGEWSALETAAGFVVDGEAKAALVRQRLAPLGEHLGALLWHGVDGLEMLAARHWFRTAKM